MSKSIVINLGHGGLKGGFPTVTVQLWSVGHLFPEQFMASLPAAPEIGELYRDWQIIYLNLCSRFVLLSPLCETKQGSTLEIEESGINNVSVFDSDELCQQLQLSINRWFKSPEFLNIDQQLRTRLNVEEEIRVIIEVNEVSLRRLPWHCWDFFEAFPKAEMALSRPEFKRQERLEPNSAKQKVRILAILGNSVGIDLQAETLLLQSIHDAEVIFLVNPEPEAFKKELLNPKSWDILFFAGHSQTEGETGRIYINENHTNNSLTIEELEIALKGAISRGLQLAIFNSCDGVGLGLALEKLNIPTVIVMREPVPNRVAQEFFHHFLQAFAVKRLPLYLAVQQARKKLVDLESEFPAASWLPVICQNPAVQTPSWLALGGIPPCPYRGLFAFQEEDAHLFFGRDKFTQQLVTAVNTKKLVAVIAPSGSGKSSVVFAGLIPYLRSHATPELPIKIANFRPGNNPFDALAAALSVAFQSSEFNSNPNVDSRLGRLELGKESLCNPGRLCNIIENIAKKNNGQRLVLVADQFEELYALISEAKRLVFLQELLQAVNDVPNFRLVITLRADFLGRVLEDECLGKALQQYPPELLIPMNHEELREAIIKPALKEGVKLEEGLIERIIDDVKQQPGHLPLLQFALTQLWETQREGILSCTAYQQIGGVEKALAKHAEQVYLRLSSTDRKRMQRIFTQLVQPGEGTADTRRLASRAEVGEENWDLVAYLASARLLVTGRHNKTGTEIVEIVHEELIRGWKELKSWMQQDREFRCWQEKLRSAIRTWESTDKDEDALLRGKTLTDAEDWFNKRLTELSLEERSFIAQSLELQQFQNNNRKRRRQLIISGLSLGLFFSLGLAGQAWWQGQNAIRSEIEALNATAEAQLTSNQEFNALITTLKASNKSKKNISPFRLHSQEKVEIQRNINNLLQEAIYKITESNRLEGHKDEVIDASFSPDGQIIATASKDKTVKLWSLDGKEITTLKGHKDLVHSVSFSRDKEPDKQIIATASWDGTVKLWTTSGKLISTLKVNQGAVNSVSFSPDNQKIATGDSKGYVKLWTREGKLITTFKAHNNYILSISFSPDSKKIATASADYTVKLWSWDDKKLKTTLNGHTDWVWSVSFSPDGKQIATASRDMTVKLWSIDGKKIKSMDDHKQSVTSVNFSPDGKMIATASADKTVILWSKYGDKIQTLVGHNNWVWRVNFSPDGKTIATASKDKTVKVIQVKGKQLQVVPAHDAEIYGISFSPDGKQIATASRDGTAKLWSPEGKLITTLKSSGIKLNDIKFHADGQRIFTTATDGTIIIWNRKGRKIKPFNKHKKFIWDISFSPNSQSFATASEDRTIKLWKQDGKLIRTIKAHDDTVNSVSFSPDGKTLATAGWDKKAKLWTLEGQLIRILTGHSDGIHSISFSPDGKIIATASEDKTVKLWTNKGKLIKTLIGHGEGVFRVRFSPDGQVIATASQDHTVKLWNLDGKELKTYRGHDDSVLSLDFSPDGRTLASGDRNGKLIVWNLDLNSNNLLAYGCNWVHDYLKNNPNVSKSDKHICDGIAAYK